MKCRTCNKEMDRVESMLELDAENQRLFAYYLCPNCFVIYNTSGELVIPSHLDKTPKDDV